MCHIHFAPLLPYDQFLFHVRGRFDYNTELIYNFTVRTWFYLEENAIIFLTFFIGLYLYVLVVKTFVAENIKLRVYACIGWGKFRFCFKKVYF